MHPSDNFKHQGKRRQMVNLMRELGITDHRVLKAMEEVPRHLFIDNAFLEYAYENKAFQIGEGQTISQPYTVAFQSQLLQVNPGEKILEIGTGSGYQTAILCRLGARVFTIERHKVLYDRTRRFLTMLGLHPKVFFGDGYGGQPLFAPFDKIIVTAGAPEIPQALIRQLKPGGIMIIPVGEGKTQKMIKISKDDENYIKTEEHGLFAFVPMLQQKAFKQ